MIEECVAVIAIVLLICLADSRPEDGADNPEVSGPRQHFLRKNLRLFGIFLFYFAVVILDIFHLAAEGACLDVWNSCENHNLRLAGIVDFFYHVTRVIFMGSEMFLCWKFNSSHFVQSTSVLLALALVQATTVAVWLDSLADESNLFIASDNLTSTLLTHCFEHGQVSNHTLSCVSKTDEEYHVLEEVSPFLYPFIMKFLSLAAECVADWYFSDGRSQEMSAINRAAAELSMFTPASPTTECENETDDDTQLLVIAESSSESRSSTALNRQGSEHENRQDSHCRRCPWYPVLLTVATVCSLGFVVVGFMDYRLKQPRYRIAFIIYRIVYWCGSLVFITAGYWSVRKCISTESKSPTGFEYFVILTCIGPFFQLIFSIIANLHTGDGVTPRGLMLVEEIFNGLEIFFQAVFYFYAKKAEFHRPTEEEKKNRRNRLFVPVCAYLTICNAAMWFEDSFVETRTAFNSFQKNFYTAWPLIFNLTNPLTLISRFNFALLFIYLLSKHIGDN